MKVNNFMFILQLITEPSSGFRQPATPVDSDARIDKAPAGSLARPSSPIEPE